MKAFRIIFVLSMLALSARSDLATKSVSLFEPTQCKACECEESTCRLDALEQREKVTLQFVIGFLQEKLDKLNRVDDFCLDCGTCHYWAEKNCPPQLPNPANYHSNQLTKEICCMNSTKSPTRSPTPIPEVGTCKDWDCNSKCNRENDPAKVDSPALNCFSCCLETCEDWQPFHMCPLRHLMVNIGNLHSTIDLEGKNFEEITAFCCEATPPPPTPPTPTCKTWLDDPVKKKTCRVDDPTTENCPNGVVFNHHLLYSEAWSCDACTQPTCKVFDCRRYGKVNDPTKDCEVSLTPETCCKPTCEEFNCYSHHMAKDHDQKHSTDVSKENCCIPTCENWRGANYTCQPGHEFDQSKMGDPISKNYNAQTGWGKCCVHHCVVHQCPPGLVTCDKSVYTSGSCTSRDIFPSEVVAHNICEGVNAKVSVGCQRMSAFWERGHDVWDCCTCWDNLYLQTPGIPVWDDVDGHEFHCMELPKERDHYYCEDIKDAAGVPKAACRVSIGGMNFCHRMDTLEANHLHCDQEWRGGLNAADEHPDKIGLDKFGRFNTKFEHHPTDPEP